MKVEVFIDYGSSSEKIATFYDEESYQYCVADLELVAKKCGGVLTESLVDDEPLNESEKERSSNFHPDDLRLHSFNQRELSSIDSDLNFIEYYLSDDYPLRKSEKELLQSMLDDCKNWAEDDGLGNHDGLEPSDVKEVISRVDSISKKLANFPTKGEQS